MVVVIAAGYFKETFLLFFFVIIHELSHAALASKYNFKVESIEIYPFGGVATIDKLDGTKTYQEIMISLAGPASNVIVALLLLSFKRAGVNVPDYEYMMDVNLALALFNLLPGLPLDGGRVLRAVLSYFVGFRKATKAAAVSGKILSVILFTTGIVIYFQGNLNISLFVVPIFIFISADREEKNIIYAIMKDIIAKGQHMNSNGILEAAGICASHDVCAGDVLKYFDMNKYHIIIVIGEDKKIMGILTESQVLESISTYGGGITLGQLCNAIEGYDKI